MNIGVEVEFTGVDRHSVAVALNNMLGVKMVAMCKHRENPDYPDDCPRYFDAFRVFNGNKNKYYYITRDISISDITDEKSVTGVRIGEYNAYDFRNEVVTPVLDSKSESDMNELRMVLAVIKSLGGVSNSSCGLHIHIDRPADVVGVFKKWIMLQEPFVDYFESYESRLEKYAKLYRNAYNYKISDVNDIFAYIKAEYDEHESLRRFALNFDALNVHNTLEFRLFNGTLDFDTVMRYINAIDDFMNM